MPSSRAITLALSGGVPIGVEIAARLPGVLSSFYDLIRPQQQRRRDRKAKGLRRLHVDDQLEFRRLFNGKVGGLGAFEDLVDVRRRASHEGVEVRPIAHQAARARPRPPTRHKGDPLPPGKLLYA